jgi:hypothetical protein
MTGLVSRPPAEDADPPAAPAAEILTNDGWFPDVDLAALREIARIDTTITPARLREAATFAMLSVNRDLLDWRAPLEEDGAENMTEIPGPEIDGQKREVFLYTRAIYSSVAADLAERLKDTSTSSAGNDRAEELACPADDHRRNARWAVRDILGLPRSTVELI